MPQVSIIVPCFNEETTIEGLLHAIHDQSFPIDQIEVIIADGYSTDDTRNKITAFGSNHPDLRVKVIDNPKRIIPAGLNRALEHAEGEYIIRLDAHSIPARDYVQRCVDHLRDGTAENVGGRWIIRPRKDQWIQRSIAYAAAHPVGAGDARYRYSQQPGYVDTVPFGSFRLKALKEVGFFNEDLLTNEDYELNVRIAASGGRIYYDPQITSIYFSRKNLLELARQYWRYGYWKLRMLRQFPKTLRWRQAIPPLFVLGVLVLILLLPFLVISRFALAFILGLYFAILLLASIPTAVQKRDPSVMIGIPLAIAVMHFSWGSGFLWSMVKSLAQRKH